jgi:hypothetical protein
MGADPMSETEQQPEMSILEAIQRKADQLRREYRERPVAQLWCDTDGCALRVVPHGRCLTRDDSIAARPRQEIVAEWTEGAQ